MIDVDLVKIAGHVVHAFGDIVFPPAPQQMIGKLLRVLIREARLDLARRFSTESTTKTVASTERNWNTVRIGIKQKKEFTT